MVADPGLALRVAGLRSTPLPWAELLPLMQVFFAQVRATVAARHQGGRLKQWLHYLKRAYPEAEAAYAELRTVNAADELAARLFGQSSDTLARRTTSAYLADSAAMKAVN
jgi:tRNA-dihydrouridine synthase C